MAFEEIKQVEKLTGEFFREKYGFWWKWRVARSVADNEYYNKFKQILNAQYP